MSPNDLIDKKLESLENLTNDVSEVIQDLSALLQEWTKNIEKLMEELKNGH